MIWAGWPRSPAGRGRRPRRGPAAARRRARTSRSASWSGARFGDEVVDRLVDPLLGGVYAGRADPSRWPPRCPRWPARPGSEHTLAGAVRAAQAAAPRAPGAPVFAAVDGGMSRLVEARRGGQRRAGSARRRRSASWPATGTGWRLPSARPATRDVDVDAVVLAVPARPAARLLAGVDRGAAAALGALDYASVALVALAAAGSRAARAVRLPGAADRGHAVKAATFFTRKWPHLRRAGRPGDRAGLARPVRRGGTRCSATTRTWPPPCTGSFGGCSARRCPPRSTGRAALGRWRCRSTRPATSTGSPPPGPRCRRAPDARAGRRRLRRGRHPGLRPQRRDARPNEIMTALGGCE